MVSYLVDSWGEWDNEDNEDTEYKYICEPDNFTKIKTILNNNKFN